MHSAGGILSYLFNNILFTDSIHILLNIHVEFIYIYLYIAMNSLSYENYKNQNTSTKNSWCS